MRQVQEYHKPTAATVIKRPIIRFKSHSVIKAATASHIEGNLFTVKMELLTRQLQSRQLFTVVDYKCQTNPFIPPRPMDAGTNDENLSIADPAKALST